LATIHNAGSLLGIVGTLVQRKWKREVVGGVQLGTVGQLSDNPIYLFRQFSA